MVTKQPVERLLLLMGSFLGFPGEDVTAAAKMLQVGLGRGQGPAALSSILGQHRAGGVSPGPRGLPCAPRGCSPAAGGAQPCGSLGRDHHQTPFIPFSSTLLHPKSQLLTQKTPNLALFGARADSCQPIPPHRCREPVPKPPGSCQAEPPPGSLLANPVRQGANWDLSDSTQCLQGHLALPPGEEEEEGARGRRSLLSLPRPLLQFSKLITGITASREREGGESGDFNYFI